MPARSRTPPCSDLIRFKLSTEGTYGALEGASDAPRGPPPSPAGRPRAYGEVPLDYVVETWRQLELFLVGVFRREPLRQRVALARRVETLVLDGWGPSLLHRVSRLIGASLSARVQALAAAVHNDAVKGELPGLGGPLVGASNAGDSLGAPWGTPLGGSEEQAQAVLKEAIAMFDFYCDTSHEIQQVCVFLGGCVVPEKQQRQQQQQAQGLQGLCDSLLRAAFEPHEETLHVITGALMAAIEAERRQERPPNPQHKKLTLLFLHLNRYFDMLERALLSCSRAALRAASSERLGAPGEGEGPSSRGAPCVSAYLGFAAAALLRERQRIEVTLHAATAGALMGVVQEELVERHREDIASVPALKAFLAAGDKEHLLILYQLFAIAGQLTLLKKQTLAAVKQEGEALLATLKPSSSKSSSSSKQFILSLLRMKDTHDEVFREAFVGDHEFVLGLKEAWESFLLADPTTINAVARLLSSHIDLVLRKSTGAPGDPTGDQEKQIDKAIGLFALIASKDAFEKYYRQDLATRLLLRGLSNQDLERTVVQRLRDECGPQYTSRIEGMLNDVKLSEGLVEKMRTDAECGAVLAATGCSFSIKVCAKGVWPAVLGGPVSLSPVKPFSSLLSILNSFYAKTAAGRKLQMLPSLGTCEVRANLGPLNKEGSGDDSCMRVDGVAHPDLQGQRVYHLLTSELQALVLLAFNSNQALSLEALADFTGLSAEELLTELECLCSPAKYAVLLREETAKASRAAFACRVHTSRLSVCHVSLSDEDAAGEAAPDADLTHQVDAGIVRLLKRASSLRHQELFAAVAEALRRPLDAAVFKKRLESLIEREYICRDTADSQAYKYAA
ncbi:hypothetical protein Esti_002442 [Eimeria stiedai]